MKIRLSIKSLTIFTLVILLIFFIGYITIIKNYAFRQQISKFIPSKVINYSKKTIFIISEFKEEIASLNKTIRNKNKKIESKNEVINYFVEEYIFDPTSSVSLIKEENLNKYISLDSQDPEIWEMFSKYFGKHKVNIYFNKMNENEVIKTDIGKFNLKKFKLSLIPDYKSWGSKSVGYIDNVEGQQIFVTGDGIFFTFNTGDINHQKIKAETIPTNLRTIIKSDEFYSLEEGVNAYNIRDLKIINNKIYISYIKEISTDCFNTSILVANLNFDLLNFEDFFSDYECINKSSSSFNIHQSGGRIFPFKNGKLLLTIGEYSHRTYAQNKDNLFGKIISIDIETKEHEIISMGHRNPQGLYYSKKHDFIIFTEHGPSGGDEININSQPGTAKIENYGWPIASYGYHYNETFENLKEAPLHKSHSKYGFLEPIKNYTPGIGISEIIEIPKTFDPNFKNDYFVAAMGTYLFEGDLTIHHIRLNDDFDKIIYSSVIPIGERIRDLSFLENENKIIMILENTPSIGIIEK